MSSNNIYSRRIMGLDQKVWRVMMIMSLVSLGLLSYKLSDKKKCLQFTFKIKTATIHPDSVYYAGENLTFIPNSNQNFKWDFGDNTDKLEGESVTHKFAIEGKHYISAKAYEGCEWGKTITVINPPASTSVHEGEKILGPSSVPNTSSPEFVCSVLANSYVWSVKNYPNIKPQGSGEKVLFHFPAGGVYTVQVTLDNDRLKTYTKELYVEDLSKPKSKDLEVKPLLPPGLKEIPRVTELQKQLSNEKKPLDNPIIRQPEKQPEKQPEVVDNSNNEKADKGTTHKSLKASDDQFKTFLEHVQEGEWDVEQFNKYLCNHGGTKVIENGKNTSFGSFCQKLKGNKKMSINSVHLNRDEENCVISIIIDYKKKHNIFGL